MAMKESCGSEDDLIAILDTGCNAACHGSHWYEKFVKATGCPEVTLNNCAGSMMKGIVGNLRVGGKRLLEVCIERSRGSFARGTLPSLELMRCKLHSCSALSRNVNLDFRLTSPTTLSIVPHFRAS